ncbi:MAG: branched-chain amino acid ABC transporter permease, partial [Clostridia bacterium]|nr:branched-chain amino acid ABC transporter permease [Clostridia bacterium]
MKNKNKRDIWLTLAFIILIYAAIAVLEQIINPNHILFTVLKKAAVYSLVAVSMNLLNGFTGLFSLGQAGFMLLGAYT